MTKPLNYAGALTVLALCFSSAPASAQAVVDGFDDNTLAANDDGFVGPVSLGFLANFYGENFDQVYVNNNGNVTFGSGLSTYTPFGLGSGYTGAPIIAPFFADIDTRASGSDPVTYGTGMFDGYDAFGVNWVDVGYFARQDDKLNSLQLILVDRSDVSAGDFDIYFNYDQITWETGSASGGTNGFGGTSAAAGFSNGTGVDGTYYQFPGSRVNGALLDGGSNALVSGSNIGFDGRYLFQVRSGNVAPPPPPMGAVPEPATWAMMLLGFFGVGLTLRTRKPKVASVRVSYG